MKKALDQTLRDLKRGVNKKVLKVPGIEQKVLDATSNEPWGPHGSHLADIAQATRNYHEYQMIMAVLWKRINDTGKNWRHVYKALTVLEYLVANGSERVIDEIKEHAYQISTLSDFQYIDHNGRDQGNNVRKKSQSLVILVNDKERIEEVRQKANVNREKFRTTSTTGGMYRPGSYSSGGGYGDDDRPGYREDDRNGYGREREWGREDDRYGRGGDSYSRDGDRYGRDSDDRYGRDGYREDDNRGRSRSTDDFQYGSRSRSSDGYRDRSYDDDGRYSSRSSGARPEDSQDERRLERKFSEQNIGAPPPPYEEVVSENRSPVHDERDGDTAEAPAPKESSPTGSLGQSPSAESVRSAAPPAPQEFGGFDEFDPRGPVSAPPPPAHNGEVDFLGSLSDSFSSNALALMPATSSAPTPEADAPVSSGSGPTFVALSSASTVLNQPVQDPFGDSPFKATPTDNFSNQIENTASTSHFQPTAMPQTSEPSQQATPNMETPSFDFGDTFSGITYTPSSFDNMEGPSSNLQLALQDPSMSNQNTDVLADILPPSGSSAPVASQPTYPMPGGQYVQQSSFSAPGGQFGPQNNFNGNYHPQGGYTGQPAPQGGYTSQPAPQGAFYTPNTGQPAPQGGYTGQSAPQGAFYTPNAQPPQQNNNVMGQSAPQGAFYTPNAQPPQQNNNVMGQPAPQGAFYTSNAQPPQQNNNVMGNLPSQTGYAAPVTSHYAPATTGISANNQPQKKFQTKSTVWADTLSKGLVDLNISGAKTNPLADIGVDFDSINRRERRERPPPTTAVTSTITMGKAMGSGSGMGRAGAGSLAPPTNPGMGMNGGAGMRMGMGGNPGMGMGMMNMGNFGGMNQQPNGMGMGMNMGVGQGGPMRPPTGVPPGNYNPMMGPGGYPQQPYGGYR